MRTRRALLNVLSGVAVQATSIASGLVLPRLLISEYGSTANGLVASLTQIVSYWGLVEGGVAAAAGASLYEPLRTGGHERVNSIMTAVHHFYLRTGTFFALAGAGIATVYPFYLRDQISPSESLPIVLLLSTMSVVGYLVFNKYNMMLVTDQKHYITLLSAAGLTLITLVIQVGLIKATAPLLAVLAAAPPLALLRLLLIRRYIRRTYPYLSYRAKPDQSALTEKWNALAFNLSQIAKAVVPLVVLSLMYDLKVVSVYSVYAMLFRVGSSILETASFGLTSGFGNVLAGGDRSVLTRAVRLSDFVLTLALPVQVCCFSLLVVPFVTLYVGPHSDADYSAPLLAVTMAINEAVFNFRFTSKTVIRATGRLRAASRGAGLELLATCVITPVVCARFGYQAVMIGSIVAGVAQTVHLYLISSSVVPDVRPRVAIGRVSAVCVSTLLAIWVCRAVSAVPLSSSAFVFEALICVTISASITLATTGAVFRNDFLALISQFRRVMQLKTP